MGYYEGEIGSLCGNGGNNNGGFGDWSWIVGLAIIGALFGGFGGNGFGGGRGGSDFAGWQLGRLATTNDVASGFSTSEIMSDLNAIILGQATMQNFINQGFAGINTSLLQGNYALSSQLADCCCKTQGAIADVKYANERNTCDIIAAINAGNQRLVDIYTNDKIDTLNRKLSLAENTLARRDDTDMLLRAINRDRYAEPAYIVPNPNCCYNYNVTQGCGCGCNGGF